MESKHARHQWYADDQIPIKADTKFIILTGHAEKLAFESSVDFKVSHYLLKPISFDKLFASLERCFSELAESGGQK